MTQPATILLCPKCTAEMRSYERNGVTIDQCTSCKGIFLDRGELERLIDAEASFYAGAQPAAQAPVAERYDARRGHDDDEERYRSRGEHGGRSSGHGGGYDSRGRKRRGGFLGELFD